MLTGENIILRAIEPSDIDILYQWENDTSIWRWSNTVTPFSHHNVEQYVLSEQDIYAQKQLRLMICIRKSDEPIGSIDLFDFEPQHQRAGIGIIIANKEERGKNYASEALGLLIDYCFATLHLHQLYCNIDVNNEISLRLFQKHDFQIIGTKRDWIREGNKWCDEYLLQLIPDAC